VDTLKEENCCQMQAKITAVKAHNDAVAKKKVAKAKQKKVEEECKAKCIANKVAEVKWIADEAIEAKCIADEAAEAQRPRGSPTRRNRSQTRRPWWIRQNRWQGHQVSQGKGLRHMRATTRSCTW